MNFLEHRSDIFRIFEHLTSKNVVEQVLKIFQENEYTAGDFDVISGQFYNVVADCPSFLFTEVIMREIAMNLRHRDKSEKIELRFEIQERYLVMSLKNRRSKETKSGGGHGLNTLDKLALFPDEIIKYTDNRKSSDVHFKQELKLKLVMK